MYTIDHFGLVVPNIQLFLEQHKALYHQFTKTSIITNETQKVFQCFIGDEFSRIELLEPLDESSPICSFLDKNKAGGLIHVCYRCDNIEVAIKELESTGGAKRISHITSDVGHDGRRIVFMVLANQVIELVEHVKEVTDC